MSRATLFPIVPMMSSSVGGVCRPGLNGRGRGWAVRSFSTGIKALIEPAAIEGVAWDEDAITFVVRETSGYPYFLQQFGQDTWNDAPGPAITLPDARVGAARGRAALDDGFFRARWDRATRAEQRYLRAMASDGDAGSSSGDVAARLGRGVNSFGPAGASLISKGLIFAPEHGIVAFTVPGMADFIQRQPNP